MIKIYNITDLPERYSKEIRKELMWPEGGMRDVLDYNFPKTKIALYLMQGFDWNIVCWATMSDNNYEGDDNWELGCWTRTGWRRRGLAGVTISNLFDALGIVPGQQVNTYKDSLANVVKSIGYTPNNLDYDDEEWSEWVVNKFGDRYGGK